MLFSPFRKQLACFCLLASERLRRDSNISASPPEEDSPQQCLAWCFEFSSRVFDSMERLPLIDDILSSPESDPIHTSLLEFLRLLSSFSRLSRSDFFLDDEEGSVENGRLVFPIFGQNILLAILQRVPAEWLREFYSNSLLSPSRDDDDDENEVSLNQHLTLITSIVLFFETGKLSLDDVEISLCGVHVPVDVLRIIFSFREPTSLHELLDSFGLVSRECHYFSLQCVNNLTIYPQRKRAIPYASIVSSRLISLQFSASCDEWEKYESSLPHPTRYRRPDSYSEPPPPLPPSMSEIQLYLMIDFIGLNCSNAETILCMPNYAALKHCAEIYLDFLDAWKRVASTSSMCTRFPMLRKLAFRRAMRHTWNELSKNPERMERFQQVRLVDLSIPNLSALNVPWFIEWCEGLNVNELAFSVHQGIVDFDESVIQSLANTVTVLSLTMEGHDTSLLFPLFPLIQSPNLTFLRFFGPAEVLQSLDSVSVYPDLESLRLTMRAEAANHPALTVSFPSLKALSLSFLPKGRFRNECYLLDPISLDLCWRHLSTLEAIHIVFKRSYNSGGDDERFDQQIRSLLEEIPRLRRLKLEFRFPKSCHSYHVTFDCCGRSLQIVGRGGELHLPDTLRRHRREALLDYDGFLRLLADALSPSLVQSVLKDVVLRIAFQHRRVREEIEQPRLLNESGELDLSLFPGSEEVMETMTRLLGHSLSLNKNLAFLAETSSSRSCFIFLADWTSCGN